MKVDHDGCGVSTVASRTTGLLVLLIATASIYPFCGVADESQSAVSEKQTLPPLKSSNGIVTSYTLMSVQRRAGYRAST
jgi:hypothetical protein